MSHNELHASMSHERTRSMKNPQNPPATTDTPMTLNANLLRIADALEAIARVVNPYWQPKNDDGVPAWVKGLQ